MMARKKELSRKLYREDSIAKMQAKIDLLGYKNTYDAKIFMNIRILSSAFLFFMILYLFEWGYIGAPILTFLYYVYLPRFAIDKKIEKRRAILENDAIYFFEVLTLALESGRNLTSALTFVASNIDSELSSEFKKALEEVRFGKSLNEALQDLKKRIPSDTINNIILNISQSNIFGSNIIETMYNQLDYIGDKKILEAKAHIAKIPIKVSVISVIFFIPLLMLLILSPVLIDYFIK